MKKKNFILGVLLPLICCCSCGPTFSWDRYANDFSNMSLESRKLKNYKVNTNYKEIDKHREDLLNVVESKGSVSKFNSLINTVYADYASTMNSLTVLEIRYYCNPNEDGKEKYEAQYDYYLEFYQFLLDLEAKIAESSDEIKKSYYGDMTEEEIDQEVVESNKRSQASVYEGQLKKIEESMEEKVNDYQKGILGKNGYINATLDAYLEYIDIANNIKDIYELDSYLDYVYEDTFGRDYSVDDALKFCRYMKKYMAPIYATNQSINKPKGLDNNFLKKFENSNFCNRETKAYELYEDYAEELGGTYLERYNALWRDGYYVFTDSPDSFSTAFVTTLYDNLFNVDAGVVYFSAGYQSIMNLIHEFGHYYALTLVEENNDQSYDVKETHSQGDEYTFLNYLVNVRTDDPHTKEYQYFADSKVYNDLFYLVNEACIAEIEAFAFGTENLDRRTLKAGIDEIIGSYRGAADEIYWCYPCVASCGYYISYATSALESLQFYDMTFEKAKKTYIDFVENPVEDSVVKCFTNAGLLSPFDEDTFIELSEMYTNIAKKYK